MEITYLKKKYKPEIDGLRAIAVIAVIINHFDKDILPSGYLGVDIFFVISGYVITSSITSRRYKHLNNFLLDFFSRRFIRLIPALVFFLLIIGTLICLFNPTPRISLITGMSSIFGVSNLYTIFKSTDYFAQSTTFNPFIHTWSLAVEEQFYFLFPFLTWFTGYSINPNKNKSNLSKILLFLCTFSLILFIYFYINNTTLAYFLMPTRFWEIAAGSLLFLEKDILYKYIKIKFKNFDILIAFLILLLFFIPEHYGIIATILIVLLTLNFLLVTNKNSFIYSLLTNNLLTYIGKLSYSLYLWHWGILALARWTIGIKLNTLPYLLILIVVISIISYELIEQKFRYIKINFSSIKQLMLSFLTLLLAFAQMALNEKYFSKKLYLGTSSPEYKPFYQINNPKLNIETNLSINNCNLTPQYLHGKEIKSPISIDEEFILRCIQNKSSKKRIILIGDSFAQITALPLANIANELEYDFKILFGYNCPYPFDSKRFNPNQKSICNDLNVNSLVKILSNNLNNQDLLVIRTFASKDSYIKGNSIDEIASNYVKEIKYLKQNIKSKIIIIGGNPKLDDSHLIKMRPQWFNYGIGSSDEYISKNSNLSTIAFHNFENIFINKFKGNKDITYFSLKKYLCNKQNNCFLKTNGKPLYNDKEHLSAYGYELFWKDLKNVIDWN